MAKIERIFSQMASNNGIVLDDTGMYTAVNGFVDFLRSAMILENDVKQKLRDFGPDQFRTARQRIISASAGITPERLCEPPANDNTGRTGINRIQHSR